MSDTPKQCKERTRSGTVFGVPMILRCCLERGHAGQHIALSPSSNSYMLTKWSYEPREGAPAEPQEGAPQ